MKRGKLWLVLAALAAGGSSASAQLPDYNRNYSYMRPPVLSPYLNLALGRDPAVNYFLGVRSEMDRRTNERVLGSAILDLDRRVTQTEPNELFPTLSGTGHPSAFMNYGSYFNFGGSGRPGAAGTGPRRGR